MIEFVFERLVCRKWRLVYLTGADKRKHLMFTTDRADAAAKLAELRANAPRATFRFFKQTIAA